MRDEIGTIHDAGAELVLVGNGNETFARAFREDLDLGVPILIDTELTAYRAAGLRRGRTELFSPRLPANAVRALWSGYRQNSVEGDPWQLGGVFVVREDGELLFRQRSREAGDHADPKDIVAALRANVPIPGDELEDPPWWQRWSGQALGRVLDPTILLSFDRTGFLARSLSFSPGDLDVDLRGRRCVITGANSGVGFETALALADLGAEVVLACRNPERGESAAERIRETTGNARVRPLIVDLSDLGSIRRAAAVLEDAPVDRLIHNAGVLPDSLRRTHDDLELTFATHVIGPHLLTKLLRSRLCASDDARVLWISSGGMYTSTLNVDRMTRAAEPYDGVLAYAQTKRAQVVLAELWARELAGQVVVHSMHPGWADTPAVRSSLPNFHALLGPLLRTPAEGADTIVWLAVSEKARATTGRFFLDREPRRTHLLPFTRESEEERERLWAVCEEMTGDDAVGRAQPQI